MSDVNKLTDQDLEQVAGGISKDQALEAALNHAKLKKDEVDFIKKVELDYENGRKIYEVKFYKGNYEFEYEVDANSGKILKADKDLEIGDD